jgi:hypothetical protein
MDDWAMALLPIETALCKYNNIFRLFADVGVLHQHFYVGWCLANRSVLKILPNKKEHLRRWYGIAYQQLFYKQ